MDESAEDLFSADPVFGEVDFPWQGVSVSGCELAEGPVRSRCVVVQQGTRTGNCGVQHAARCREPLGRWQMDQLAIDDGGGVIRGS